MTMAIDERRYSNDTTALFLTKFKLLCVSDVAMFDVRVITSVTRNASPDTSVDPATS
jgi:hypothetical protein